MKKNRDEVQVSYWLSISDLMAAVLAIFILFFIGQVLSLTGEKQKIKTERDSFKVIIDELEGTKEDIIRLIQKKISINIDNKTGNIRLDSEILFETDKYDLKPEGKEFLKVFIPKYLNVLLGNMKIRKNLSQIIVEGHTDKQGTYLYNLKLSQNRALAVVNFIFSKEMPDFPERKILKNYITANGRSFVDFLGQPDQIKDKKSRRVEFKFILNESNTINRLKKAVKE